MASALAAMSLVLTFSSDGSQSLPRSIPARDPNSMNLMYAATAACAAFLVGPEAAGGIQVLAPGEGEITTLPAVLPGFQAGGFPFDTDVTEGGCMVVAGRRLVVLVEASDIGSGCDITDVALRSADGGVEDADAGGVGGEVGAGIVDVVGLVGFASELGAATAGSLVPRAFRTAPPVSVTLQPPSSTAPASRSMAALRSAPVERRGVLEVVPLSTMIAPMHR